MHQIPLTVPKSADMPTMCAGTYGAVSNMTAAICRLEPTAPALQYRQDLTQKTRADD